MATLGYSGSGHFLGAGSGPRLAPPAADTGALFWHYPVAPQAPYTGMSCSVGVAVDGVLVRTLFNNEWREAGTYYAGWNRLDDEGYPVNTVGKTVKLRVLL
ncbi:MAG: hypothetical protein EOO36_19970, partial [Cytophagaceae bacterium]